MPREPSIPENERSLIIRREAELAILPEVASAALTEIINRSLVHIQTSKDLAKLYRIGEHEVLGPDYRLVCAWAEELDLAPDDVLERLLRIPKWAVNDCVTVLKGHFRSLYVDGECLPISYLPKIKGLEISNIAMVGNYSGAKSTGLPANADLMEFIRLRPCLRVVER